MEPRIEHRAGVRLTLHRTVQYHQRLFNFPHRLAHFGAVGRHGSHVIGGRCVHHRSALSGVKDRQRERQGAERPGGDIGIHARASIAQSADGAAQTQPGPASGFGAANLGTGKRHIVFGRKDVGALHQRLRRYAGNRKAGQVVREHQGAHDASHQSFVLAAECHQGLGLQIALAGLLDQAQLALRHLRLYLGVGRGREHAGLQAARADVAAALARGQILLGQRVDFPAMRQRVIGVGHFSGNRYPRVVPLGLAALGLASGRSTGNTRRAKHIDFPTGLQGDSGAGRRRGRREGHRAPCRQASRDARQ